MIEIHLDGKPVSKLQAARALANLDGEGWRVDIGESADDGRTSARTVTVYASCCRQQGHRPVEVSCPSTGCVPAVDARAIAEAIILGAEVAELAEMLAAEQDALPPEPGGEPGCPSCDWLDGHHPDCKSTVQAPASLVGRIVVDHADDSPCPVTGKVVGQVDEETVEVLWGDRQHEENPGTGTYEPIDALRPAREQAGA